MKNLFVRFVREDAGQDLIEYGLLVGIITVGAIASIKPIGPKVATYFSASTRSCVFANEGGVVRPQASSSDGGRDVRPPSNLSSKRAKETMSTFSASRFARALAAQFTSDDSGQDLIEYALLTAIIAISGVLILSTLSDARWAPAYIGWNTAGQNAWQPCPPQPAACP